MSDVDLAQALADCERLSLPDLRKMWSRLFVEPVPKLRARDLLAMAIAYRLQARAEGDLARPLKRRTVELARRFEQDRTFTPVTTRLRPGSSLVKEWRGARHEVRVLENGFAYDGEVFGSLSAVALRVTGTKWNGQVFFGLKTRSGEGLVR